MQLKVKFYTFAFTLALHHIHENKTTTARLPSRSTVKQFLTLLCRMWRTWSTVLCLRLPLVFDGTLQLLTIMCSTFTKKTYLYGEGSCRRPNFRVLPVLGCVTGTAEVVQGRLLEKAAPSDEREVYIPPLSSGHMLHP